MKNILSEITQEEKNRILEMHVSASKKHYIFESNGSGSEKLGLYAMEDGKKIGGIDATNIKYEGNPEAINVKSGTQAPSDYLSFDYTYAGDTEKSRGQYFCKDKVVQVLNAVEFYSLEKSMDVTKKRDVEHKRYKLSSDGEKMMDSYCNQYAMNKQNNDELTAWKGL